MEQATPIPVFKTQFRVEKEAKELAIYNEYNELMKAEGQSRTAVTSFLMQKHGIHSQSTIYEIRKKVEERLAKETAQ